RHAARARRRRRGAEGVPGVDEERAQPPARLLRRGEAGEQPRAEEARRDLLGEARRAHPAGRQRALGARPGEAPARREVRFGLRKNELGNRALTPVSLFVILFFLFGAALAEPGDEELDE